MSKKEKAKEKGKIREIKRPASHKLDAQLRLAMHVARELETSLKDGRKISSLVVLNALACTGTKLVDNWGSDKDEPFWAYYELTNEYPF
jgi:hypothetical protein